MSIRGRTAIVGFGELPSVRSIPGRTSASLLAEVSGIAIRDAGLRKDDIDGLITHHESVVNAETLAEWMRIKPDFCEAISTQGAAGAASIAMAAMVVSSGVANCVLCTFGGTSDPEFGGVKPGRRPAPPASVGAEWENPFGPVVAMNGWYGLLKNRHMHQYGTTDRQFAKIAANQRFNALTNPNALFKGQPITVEDVLNSRYTNEPIHLLESVMPCTGAMAVIVTSAERARLLPNPPVYVLGVGGSALSHYVFWQETGDITVTPVMRTSRRAYQMAGYGAKDIQFAEMYD
ncbi:MAG: thiolase family protein [Dehalococcoidia bacterium]|nr:thiolase family protein [Dehalococcoidia bacterium]